MHRSQRVLGGEARTPLRGQGQPLRRKWRVVRRLPVALVHHWWKCLSSRARDLSSRPPSFFPTALRALCAFRCFLPCLLPRGQALCLGLLPEDEGVVRVSCTKNNSNPKGDRETKQTNKKKGFGFGAKTGEKSCVRQKFPAFPRNQTSSGRQFRCSCGIAVVQPPVRGNFETLAS